MSTNNKADAPAASTAGASAVDDEFSMCIPAEVAVAKVMGQRQCATVWSKIYNSAGVGSAGEPAKKALRCAVYAYCAENGTSSAGGYPGEILTGAGTKFQASVIPACAGRYEVRQFMRGNAAEAARFFQKTKYLESSVTIRAKCDTMEIPISSALALVDYLDCCPTLTPAEKDAQAFVKAYALRRAQGARGGLNTEEVRDKHYNARLAVNETHATNVKAPSGAGW